MALRLGLTGPYCSGKNTAAHFLEEAGFLVLDVDKLGHRALSSARDAVAGRFGPSVIAADGSVDRRALGAIVFKDRRALSDLEAIVHPEANLLAEEWLAAHEGRDLCVNAALLHLMPSAAGLDAVIRVVAPFPLRLWRGLRRDGRGLGATLHRMARQWGFARALRKLGVPTVGILNLGSREALLGRVRKVLEALRSGRKGSTKA